MKGIWEKCARLLLLNSATDIIDLVDTCEKIVNNIINNPNEEKYRTIKISNKHVHNKILSKTGGFELFIAFGFVSETDNDGNKVLRLSSDEVLSSGIEWLRNTSNVCIDFASSKADTVLTRCCECEIQLRLPTGSSVSGGFMSGDTLQDVKDFALCYFQECRSAQVQLKTPPSNRSVSEDELQLTLKQLDLCPRAVVLVTALSDEEHIQSLEKVCEV